MARNQAAGARQEGVGKWTPFGEVMRAIRREKGILLIDMARIAEVSPGFLSLVETGKKPIPDRLIHAIVSGLDLDTNKEVQLREGAALSAKEYKIHLEAGAAQFDRKVAHALQTGFAKMSTKNKAKILKLLEEG